MNYIQSKVSESIHFLLPMLSYFSYFSVPGLSDWGIRFWQTSLPYLNQGGPDYAHHITTCPPPAELPTALLSLLTFLNNSVFICFLTRKVKKTLQTSPSTFQIIYRKSKLTTNSSSMCAEF